MKNMSCDTELSQKVDFSWMNSWISSDNEENLCFLSLPNNHDNWFISEDRFSCGSSGVRILMCDKAFKLLQKVSHSFKLLCKCFTYMLFSNLYSQKY